MRYEQAILEMIDHSSDHMTAEETFFKLKERYPAVAMATVYNNLNSLCRQGRIRRICVENQPDRYDKNVRHDHLICDRCGKLEDVFLPDFTADLENRIGFSIESYDLKVHYVCPDCRRNHSKETN